MFNCSVFIVYSTTIPNFKMTNEINALFENQNVNFGNDWN